ncbi:hypothetical protein OOJ91_11890 [Micromonospora lupini]|uniref:hypothetical protein n=1 Tax=Micromonospora lupini TaxID=285679 RepID=UPI00225B96F1|nr:hypothetical protein [Micromonospora lupini]MCX5066578.1 hypothetical protein [Micromonospora lupini]
MNWDIATKVAVAALALAVALVQNPFRSRNPRKEVKEDLEIYNALPEGSESREALARYVDERVLHLIEDEGERRRDLWGAFGGVVIIAFAGLLIFGSMINDRPAWISIPLIIIGGLIGWMGYAKFYLSFKRAKRDHAGNLIDWPASLRDRLQSASATAPKADGEGDAG